ncbi:MAG: hypothetical protein MUC92_07790 [Fimbriimonadaceae bacterium]|nr:hypothetical protein [Fimbriimonadaceae bacterium]
MRPEQDVQASPGAHGTSSVSTVTPITPVSSAAPNLERSSRRLEAASRLVSQFSDLIQTVREGVIANQDRPEAMEAGKRLVASAAATAKDLLHYAKVDGEPLFASAPKKAGVRAYVTIQNAFRTPSAQDATEAAAAINGARETLGGQRGIVNRLAAMAEFGPTEGFMALAQLGEMADQLETAQAQIQDAGRTLSGITAPPTGSSLDLTA